MRCVFCWNKDENPHEVNCPNDPETDRKQKTPFLVICPYCLLPAEYINSDAIYRWDYGMLYACCGCDAWVGTHKGTSMPLGRLANKELREWKQAAHKIFDPLWRARAAKRKREEGDAYYEGRSRGVGYKWLANELGIDVKQCHIGMFDVEMCKRVVEICTPHTTKLKGNYDGK